jgi:hypothetical protein
MAQLESVALYLMPSQSPFIKGFPLCWQIVLITAYSVYIVPPGLLQSFALRSQPSPPRV